LTLIALTVLLAVRGHPTWAGSTLGLAIATKTLPALFLPYLALKRTWRLIAVACACAGVLFALACGVQGTSPWEGLYSLVYQNGDLTKLEYGEYEYTPRAEIARALAGPGGFVTPDQARLAITLHWVISLTLMALIAWLLARTHVPLFRYAILFGLIETMMLVVSPSGHAQYYIFLLPGWTAIMAALLEIPFSPRSFVLWSGLVIAYVFTGFDQVFFAMQRLFGFGIVVPQHWFDWHLPSIGVLVTLAILVVLLRRPIDGTAVEGVATVTGSFRSNPVSLESDRALSR
jgi:hypothetical protein